MRRQTLSKPVVSSGIGIHSGERASVRLSPLAEGAGIRFWRNGVELPALARFACPIPGAMVLERDGVQVRTPEHLLAALYGLGVSDCRIDLEGEELPIRDGSALPWCEDLLGAGLVTGAQPWEPLVVSSALRVESHGGVAEAWPDPGRRVSVTVDYGEASLPRGEASVDLEVPADFLKQVAPARTYVLERDVLRLRAAGRGKGATTENTVVWGDAGPLTALRMPGEVPRHKLLDLVGDLALVGRPVVGRIQVARGSHALHRALVLALLQQRDEAP